MAAFSQSSPILVIGTSTNPFTAYYTHILRAEGINTSDYVDISAVTAATLSTRDVVILGEMTLTSSQVSLLTTWVTNGGNLIAMRPDKQLAGLLGITVTSSTIPEGYLLIDTTRAPGLGLVNQTIQYHGTADVYGFGGATAVATLYSNSTTPTGSPAVSLRSVGVLGGNAAAFTYDLARSIVYTRQGNPAWSGTERDGSTPIRSDDMFFGPAAGDPQPDWVNRSKIGIPQADEQQRLLANLILHMNFSRKPLPRFWYFPFGKKAAIVMTGDDHALGGTSGRFNAFRAASPTGCVVDNWECVRGTSYMYSNSPMTAAQAQSYNAEGFEVALHVSTNCLNYTPSSFQEAVSDQLADWRANYTGIPSPVSNRTHCIAFSDWATQPQVELANGMRMDVNYYYFPPAWVNDTPGFMTGSGMPMRFANLNGSVIDTYQAETQMTDESGQTYPFTIDTLLDRALGPQGYYGFFVANMHTDFNLCGGICPDGKLSEASAMQIVSSAQARGVPVVSAAQLLRWVDGRNNSTFSAISWSGNNLNFTVTAATGSNGLRSMVPATASAGTLASITRNGVPVSFTIEAIKGVAYAVFSSTSGNYVASYFGAPVTIAVAPTTATLSASQTQAFNATVTGATDTSVTWSINPQIGTITTTGPSSVRYDAPSTISASTAVTLTATSNADAFRTASATITLNPSSGSGSFVRDTTTADFSAGAMSSLYVAEGADGELVLQPAAATEFSGSTLPAGWTTAPWNAGGTSTVSAGSVAVDGSLLSMNATNPPGTTLEFGATFTTGNLQHVGYGTDLNSAPWAIFSTGSGGTLYARTNNGSAVTDTNLGASYLSAPHQFRIQWDTASVTFFIDGVQVASHPVTITTPMRALASELSTGGDTVKVDWVRLTPYALSGNFSSRVLDAGSASDWGNITWTADLPAGSNLAIRVRKGNTPVPDGSWTTSTIASNGASVGGNSRYIQYDADFTTTDPSRTPVLRDVTIQIATAAPPSQPTISGVAATPTHNTAVVTWTTNVASNSRVEFGTSPTSLFLVAADSASVTAHAISLTGLNPATTYYYRVISATGTGSATSPLPPAAPLSFVTRINPPVITNTSVSTGITSVTVTWTTNVASNTVVNYGTSPSNLNLSVNNTSQVTSHSIGISSLTANTTYYYRVSSTNTGGGTTTFPDVASQPGSFSTTDSNPPVVSAVSALPAVGGLADIRWTTNKLSNSRVNYGTSQSSLNLNVSNSSMVNDHVLRLSGLTQGTRYYYRVVSVDPLGNSTTFPPTTSSPLSFVENAVSLWNRSATPEVLSENDTAGIEVGMKFRSDATGSVTGMMFYKGVSNTGTHTGNLWGPDGTLLSSVTFANETASGWQMAFFPTPVTINANTTYVVSYYAPNGGYSVDEGFFAGNTVVVAPLRGLADGVDGSNGVYRYTTASAFPNTSFLSSNYWVDVIFVDTASPQISNISAVPAGSSATISWTTNESATGQIQYGVSSSNLNLTATAATANTTQSVVLSGLTASTTYFYRIVATDIAGNATTNPAPPATPLSFSSGTVIPVTISNVTGIAGSATALITWTTNLGSNSRVDYGTSSSNLNQSTTNAAVVTSHSVTLNNLLPNTTYFYRVQSTVTTGNSATSPNPPAAPLSFRTTAGSSGGSGNPPEEWDISGAGDVSIQGYTTDISYNVGETVRFKINTDATAYRIDIYRLGYYGGDGASLIATVNPSVTLPQNQPGCLTDASTGLIDCGNWAQSAQWVIPANAKSGIYVARPVRADDQGASHIVFVVRNDASHSDIVFQASDTTWQAYNQYAGNSLYVGNPDGRAYKVSYNRPFATRATNPEDWLFNAEYPMIRWLEANGYDVTYIAGVDTDRRGNLLTNHKVFMSVGHDEYWSGTQRTNVEAARAAGVNLAFFSGNEVFWKTRWENSISTPATAYRTLVCYKETHADAKIDPTPAWTGTWRDPRFSPPADGGRPENALTGTIFTVNCCSNAAEVQRTITVSAEAGKMRFWRNTTLATMTTGQTATLNAGLLGYEWDEDLDNGFRPAGLMRLSSTTLNIPGQYLLDYGTNYGNGTATHALTLYRHTSGARVFGAGTAQWSWGLDGNHDRGGSTADLRVQQATVNLLADMGVQPATIQSGLLPATASTDTTPPTSTFTSPTSTGSVSPFSLITVTGTASDTGGSVAAVEISLNGGATWKRATGTTSWTFTWNTLGAGPATLMSRAVDDTGNTQNPATSLTVTVGGGASTCNPCSIWPTGTPTVLEDPESAPVELGLKFQSAVAGQITGIRFYKGTTNTGAHIGSLWSSTGSLLATVTFSNETGSGWQQASFPTPVNITANTTYVISYFAPNGHYAINENYFATTGAGNGPLAALPNGADGPNGIYALGHAFPTSTFLASNYWVDVIFVPGSAGPDTTAPVISGVTAVPGEASATIQWTTNESATARVDYGTSPSSLNLNVASAVSATSATIVLPSLLPGTTYYFRVTATDAAGNAATVPAAPAAPLSFLTTDTTPPVITAVTATPAETSATVQWTTNEPATARVDYGTSVSSLNLNVVSTQLTTSRTLTLPTLTAGTTYYYRVTSTDAAGNSTTSPVVSASPASFVTLDSTAPVISAITAVPGPTSATVRWTTNELANARVDYGTSPTSLTLNVTSATPTTSPVLSLNGLAPDTTYYFRVTSVDAAANSATSPAPPTAPMSFVTTSQAATCNPCSIWATPVPTVVDTGEGIAIELGTKFRSSVAGQVTGVRFYKSAANTGTHQGTLWSSTGTQLSTVTFTNETASGWQQAAFSAPITIEANTTYVVSYFAPNGHSALNEGYFLSQSINNSPLTALQTGIDGGNGVYRYGATSGFPDGSVQGNNYWVDVTFVPAGSADSTPPSVSGITATPSSTSATIHWTTSELATARVDYGISPTNLNLSVSSSTLSVAPTLNLPGLIPGTVFHYRVTSVDAAGNTTTSPAAAQAPLTFTTTTTPATCNPCSIWSPIATPAVIDPNDPAAVELGVKFRSSTAGRVTGIRFYKSATNTGTHVGTLWTATGTSLATVTFTGETASGWQQAAFSTPVTIEPGTTYVVSYYAPNGHYSVTSGDFTAQSVTNGPLSALQSGLDGGNGLYLYGASGFPTLTHQGSNYWVDVIFAPTGVADTTPPVNSGITVNPTDTSAVVQWSIDELATARVDYGTSATNLNLNVVSAAPTTAPVLVLNSLTPGTTYYYRVTATDAAGNTTTSPVVSQVPLTFNTPDTAAPVISGVTASVTENSATIQWTTNEPATARVNYGTSAANLNLNVSSPASTTSATVTITGLTAGTTYYYRVVSVDAAGNTSTFPAATSAPLTFIPVDSNPPVISAIIATPAANGLSATIQWTTNEPANARVDYGTSAANLNLNVVSTALATARTLTLPGLTSGTTYFYRVTSADAAGNSTVSPVATSAPLSFATPDVTAPTISGITATPAGTSATIQWTTNEPATARVDYGLSATNLNLNVSSATLATSRTLTLPGLTSGTTYFYRVTSADAAGNSSTSPTAPAAPLSFTTPDVTAPTISGITATPSANSATIQWNTNEPANARVNYGTSASNLNLNVTSATLATTRTLTLSGLSPNTTYFYRVVSADAAGNTTTSPNPPTTALSFTTTPLTATPTSVTVDTGTLNSGNAASLASDDGNLYQVNSTTSGFTRTATWYATFTNIPNSTSDLTITYRGSNSNNCTQAISIFNFSNNQWSSNLDSRTVGTSEVTISNLNPSGTQSSYVSGTSGNGEVRVRVSCSATFTNFTSRGEFMQLAY